MDEPEQIGKRLRNWAAEEFAGNMADFARAVSMKPQQVYAYFNGKSKPGNKLQARLRDLGCDIEWLMTGKSALAGLEKEKVDLVEIPVYSHVRAGNKTLVFSERPIEYIAIPRSKDGTLFSLKVKGSSMKPVIQDGDLVIISRKKDAKSGDICLVVFEDGETCIRYVNFHDHMLTLTSSNADYKPETFKKGDVRWCYKVVGLHRRFDN